jgi:hypothetical protein
MRGAASGMLLLLGVACASGAPAAVRTGPRVAPQPPPAHVLELLERAATRGAARQRMDATAVISGVPGLGGLRVTSDVHAARPARLYLGVQAFLGPPVEEVWTDGETFLWRSLRPDAGARGPATAQRLATLLPVALPPSQWVGLLLGFPLPQEAPETLLDCPPGAAGPWCAALVYASGATVELSMEADGTVRHAVWRSGETRATVTYGPPDGPLGLPRTMEVEQDGRTLGVRLTDVRVNAPAPPAALFAPLYRH